VDPKLAGESNHSGHFLRMQEPSALSKAGREARLRRGILGENGRKRRDLKEVFRKSWRLLTTEREDQAEGWLFALKPAE